MSGNTQARKCSGRIHAKSAADTGRRALVLASVASMIDLFNADNINILLNLGYRVDVAANFDSGSITSQERVDEFKQELTDRGIRVYNIPIPRSLSRKKEMLQSYKDIKRLVNRNYYTIVHCHSPIGGVLCRAACRRTRKNGTRVIYTAHGFHFFQGAGVKAWMLYYPAEKICSNFTDVLITINHEDYKAAKRLHAKKTVYVPGIGIHVNEIKNAAADREAKRAEFGLDMDDFIFMSTGQISVRKNHEIVIRALADIPDPKVKYFIAGFGELQEQLKKLARHLHVDKRVIFAGYRKDIKELLHAADAFVFPSIQEGLPVALMEAMAAGLPVVASRIRGSTDLIEDGTGGYLVNRNDVKGFSRAMKRILESDSHGMGIKNQERVMQFDTSAVNKRMIRIYSGTK